MARPHHPRRPDHPRRADHGQALPIVIGVVAVLAVLVAGIGWFGVGLRDAAQARTAADAAALAGVEGGPSAAAALAGANGGGLVSFTVVGDDVIVTVRVGRSTVTARATNSP